MTVETKTEPIHDRLTSRTLEAMLNEIHEIGPLLEDNAGTADTERRVPDSSMEALAKTGAFSVLIPKKYGGLSGGAHDLVTVARTIGRYDPSASWVTVISNGSAMLSQRFPQSAVERVFAEGPTFMSSIIVSQSGESVREGEGYRITGTWPFASNILHAEWAVLVVPLDQGPGEEPVPGYALLHRSQWEVLDTWHTIGMRGTGSNTIQVKDQWIPADQTVSTERLLGPSFETEIEADPIQRLAPVSTMATAITAPSLGAADGLYDLVRDAAGKRGITYSIYQPAAESQAMVHSMGQSRGKIDSAGMNLEYSAARLDAAASAARALTIEERAASRNSIAYAAHSLADVANDLAWSHGTALFGATSPLGRLWRDINTGTRHALVASPLGFEIGGAAQLQIEQPTPIV